MREAKQRVIESLRLAVESMPRFRVWLHTWGWRWLCCNDLNVLELPHVIDKMKQISKIDVHTTHIADVRKFAEAEYKDTADGLKEANDRQEKLLGFVLIALGWSASFATKEKPINSPLAIAVLSLAALVLLLGRSKLTSMNPISFPDCIDIAKSYDEFQKTDLEFHFAQQYYRAAYANGELAHLAQLRLRIAIWILACGLLLLALRY